MEELRKQQLEQIIDHMSQRKSIDVSLEESYQQARDGEVVSRDEVMKMFRERYGSRK